MTKIFNFALKIREGWHMQGAHCCWKMLCTCTHSALVHTVAGKCSVGRVAHAKSSDPATPQNLKRAHSLTLIYMGYFDYLFYMGAQKSPPPPPV